MTRTDLRRLLAVVATTAVLAGACSPQSTGPSPTPASTPTPLATPTPTPASSQDPSAVYRLVNDQVRAIRGLDEVQPVEPQIVSKDELATVIRDSFDEDYPPDQVAVDERLYHGLGLLPKDQKLADVFVELLESQVAGLYDPLTKGLYVRSEEGQVGPVERVFYAHEYDHALQDQAFDLTALFDGLDGETDESLARQSLVEGDAYVLMTYWLQQHLTGPELAEVIAVSSDPEALAALERIPPIVQAQLLFSATQGTQWVLTQQLSGGWDAIDQLYAAPPVSTEQILHADKWAAREAPIDVALPGDIAAGMGAGWSVGLEDTMGEYQTGIWLGPTATEAAAGWGGDRIGLFDGPDGSWAIAWRTDWDSAADATEFEAAAKAVIGSAGGPGAVLPESGGVTRWVVVGSDASVLERIAGVLGLAG